jgi:hypothetical protein
MPDPIKKSTTYDPSTGETTFKASWNGISRGKIAPKGTQRTVAARQAVRNVPAKSAPTPTVKETSGERKAVAFKSPTPAKAVGMEPKAGTDVSKMAKPYTGSLRRKMIEAKQQTANAIQKEKEEDLLKKNPGKTLNQIYNKQYREEKRSYRKGERELHRENTRILKRDSGGGGVQDKQKSGACRTC